MALIGVLLAVVLGWLVARTALVPLNSLTDTVEDVAETTDMSRRLSPGGADELGRLRRTFNRLLEALESSRRAQSQLVLDASHELRTPLTSLRTNLEVIRRVDELSAEDRSVLVDDVLVQLQELTDLVGDLAELARGDQQPAPREPLRLDLLVREAVRVQTTHGRAQDVTFDLTPSPAGSRATPTASAVPWATCSTTPASGARRARRSSVECREGTVVVHDHGPGIADGRPAAHLRPLLPLPRRPRPARVRARPGHRGPGGQGRGRDRPRRERPRRRRPHVPVAAHRGRPRRTATPTDDGRP